MIFEILTSFHHKMIEYIRIELEFPTRIKTFKIFRMIFEILTSFHHKMIEYIRIELEFPTRIKT